MNNMKNENELVKSIYESPQTLHVEVQTEGGFAGSLNDSSSGSTTTQDWTYTSNTGDSDTWN